MVSFVLKSFFHLSPLIIALLGYYALGIAALLLVGLCYIKVFKLQAEMQESKSDNMDGLKKTCNWWKSFTFLKDKP